MPRIENVSKREIQIPKLEKDGKAVSLTAPVYLTLGSIDDRAAKAAGEEGVPDSEIEATKEQVDAYLAIPSFKHRTTANPPELRVHA
jgi:hypothetical protein